MSAARTERRDSTRRKILGQAVRLFGRHGYEGTSVTMIARAAGVSQGLLYNYFESKDALLRYLVDAGVRHLHAALRDGERVRDPALRIARIVENTLSTVRRDPEVWRVVYGIRMRAPLLGRTGVTLSEWTRDFRRVLADAMRQRGSSEPEIDAALLFAAMDGIAQHFAMEPNRYPIEAVVRRLVERYVGHDTTNRTGG